VIPGKSDVPPSDCARRRTRELARPANAYIHQPWGAGDRILAAAGVRLGETYTAPIVDDAKARQRAPAAYETAK